jgi:hypothetical protein
MLLDFIFLYNLKKIIILKNSVINMVQAGAWRLVNTNIRVNSINPVRIFIILIYFIKKNT